jgi:saccharopine dehydrogenase-like NADP-dependent oxidoreductase
MTAMKVIHRVQAEGGEITTFQSYCGGLPAPEANDNPYGYKFSWAPRGVLLASRNGATYRRDGHAVETPPERLFRDVHLVHVPGAGDFEAYPNRDSLQYRGIYDLDEGIRTLLRGTLRNLGWCQTMHEFGRIGLLDDAERDCAGMTCADFVRDLLGAGPDEDLRPAAARRMGLPADALPAWNLHWLGLLSDRPVGRDRIAPLDLLGDVMLEKLAYAPGERDMVVLFHEFKAWFPEAERYERITSTLVDFGLPGGASSMSRTVSLPTALAARMILEGQVVRRGVLRPVHREIYEPVLDELEKMDIVCREETTTFPP